MSKPKFLFDECSLDRTNNLASCKRAIKLLKEEEATVFLLNHLNTRKQEYLNISIKLISSGNTTKISNKKILNLIHKKLNTIS